MATVVSPFESIRGLDGAPLDAGYVYIGTIGLNPETTPTSVYWDKELTIPAAQPLRTQQGYIVRNGTPARVYVSGAGYSIIVRDFGLRLIWSALDVKTEDASNLSYSPLGTGAVDRTVQSKLRESVSVRDFGAVGDGVTDDSVAFTTALAASYCVDIPYAASGYKATFTVPSNTNLICDNAKILGTVDCTNTQNSHIGGTMIIIPPTGATYGMKWKKTRYCQFDDIRIGVSTVANTYDGEGLRVEGGVYNGTYYNTVGKLTVLGMKGIGLRLISDAGDTIFRIGTNHFVSTAIQYCAGGVHLEGASNNVFSELSIEQCTGTILKIRQRDANSLSNGNQFVALYTENVGPWLAATLTALNTKKTSTNGNGYYYTCTTPGTTDGSEPTWPVVVGNTVVDGTVTWTCSGAYTWIDTETTAVGTLINLVNTADGTTVPSNVRSADGTLWKTRDALVVGTTGIDSYGPIKARATQINVYGAYGDTYPRQSLNGTSISVGPGSAPADCVVGRQGAGLWGVSAGSLYSLGTWDTGPLRMGSYRLWVDATGNLRIKGSAPTSDTDGTVVGTQT